MAAIMSFHEGAQRRIAVQPRPCTKVIVDGGCRSDRGVGSVTSLAASIVAVVDDDEHVLQSLENFLESHGYRVLPYRSAAAFLADEVLLDIDCLISDVSMPVMDGFELQLRVGRECPQLPVILITARPEVSGSNIASFNNRGFFQKPFDGEALLQAVASAIRGVPRG
jgi:FixJ family two-component response regulator